MNTTALLAHAHPDCTGTFRWHSPPLRTNASGFYGCAKCHATAEDTPANRAAASIECLISSDAAEAHRDAARLIRAASVAASSIIPAEAPAGVPFDG